MRKKIYTIITLSLFFLFFLSTLNGYAEMNDNNILENSEAVKLLNEYQYDDIEFENYISNMSIEELNSAIDDLKYIYENMENDQIVHYKKGYTPLELAWLLAAQVARRNGLACGATMVEYSVNGDNYYENEGLFSGKIKATTVYKNWRQDRTYFSFAFEKSDSKDLFYALHNIDIEEYGSHKARIYDTFDFVFDYEYDSLMSSSINNWGWLCQNMDVLKPIKVNIVFYM